MAISHSIGSNLFDVLLGLGLPWFLSSVIVGSGRPVIIHSAGVIYITAMLLGNVVITVVLIRSNGFVLASCIFICRLKIDFHWNVLVCRTRVRYKVSIDSSILVFQSRVFVLFAIHCGSCLLINLLRDFYA